ncbi:MAG: NAD-dependent succinate-semialdehyde dehydrogenase [Simkaniaceae bacterium]
MVSGEILAQLIPADKETADLALKRSEEAYEALKQTSSYERAEALHLIADLLLGHKQEYAKWIALEMGKTIKDAKAEIDYTAGYFRWFAEEGKRIYGKTIPSQKKKRLHLHYEAIGPVLIIIPWNFPLAMAGRKIAPAIAAGCPVICRPSSSTPLSLLLLGQFIQKTNLPKAALQIFIGDTKLAEYMLLSPIIRKLSFTGSDEVGKHLYGLCSRTVKKATMELGGHAPLIVFHDANIELAAQEAIYAKFRNNGQTCVCANRIYLQEDIAASFLEAFIEKIRQLRIGDPLDEDTDISTVMHPTSVEKVARHLTDAKEKGAKPHLHAKNPYEPEVLTQVTKEMLLFQEETFGPVAGLAVFSSKEEALAMANDTKYGLASYLFTNDPSTADFFIRNLHFGIIGLNDGLPSAPELPFGGMRDSGFGREGGPTGIYEYLMEKAVSQKL